MNKVSDPEYDILKEYLNPGIIEKAPESLTPRLMSRLSCEPAFEVIGTPKRNLVPVISGVFIIILLIAAFILPDGNAKSVPGLLSGFINYVGSSLTDLTAKIKPTINLPALITYVMVGVLLIGLFDLAILKHLHRGHKKQEEQIHPG